jgi:hypothetical protein
VGDSLLAELDVCAGEDMYSNFRRRKGRFLGRVVCDERVLWWSTIVSCRNLRYRGCVNDMATSWRIERVFQVCGKDLLEGKRHLV